MNFNFFKEKSNEDPFIYTEDQLMARLRFFIGICLAMTLTGIVFVVLYSIIFVTQPLNAISPIDQKFFELIIPIATFLTGTLSGIMLAGNDKDAKMKALEAATRPTPVSPAPTTPSVSTPRPFTPSSPSAFTAPAPVAASPFGAPVNTGFGGKAAPPPAFEPEL
jgi:hypothetical protein